MKSIFDFLQGTKDLDEARAAYKQYLNTIYGQSLTAEIDPLHDLHIGGIYHINAVSVFGAGKACTFRGYKGKVLNLVENIESDSLGLLISGLYGTAETMWVPVHDYPVMIAGIEMVGAPLDDPHNWWYKIKVIPVNDIID